MADDSLPAIPELSYAGIPFLLPTREQEEWVDRVAPWCDMRDVLPPAEAPPYGLQGVAYARPPAYPELRVNDYFYPLGATRWSIFRGLASESQALQMLNFARQGSQSVPQKFVMRNLPVERTGFERPRFDWLETDLYMLPPRVLAETGETQGERLFLVTLVDKRYFWQFGGPVTGVICTGNTGTWISLASTVLSALGGSFGPAGFGAVDSAYGSPEPDSWLYSVGESLPVILDAAAANCGRVLKRRLDGTYEGVKYRDLDDAALAGHKDATAPDRALAVAGGQVLRARSAANDQPNNPGMVNVMGQKHVLPQTIHVAFPIYVTGYGYYEPTRNRDRVMLTPGGVVYHIVNTSSDLNGDYAAFGRSPYTVTIRTTAKALFNSVADAASGTATATNSASLATTAERLARDYLDAQLASLDASYAGVAPYALSYDALFSWRRPECGGSVTRVRRWPWNWYPPQFQHSFGPTRTPPKVAPVRVDDGATADSCTRYAGHTRLYTDGGCTVANDLECYVKPAN